MSDATDTIYLIDEIELLPDVADDFLAALDARYVPGARSRGMELVHVWITPPEPPPGVGPTVLLVWALAGVPGFWRMRSRNSAPEIADWWREAERYHVRRTRRVAVTPDARAGFSAAGRVHP